MEFFIFLIVFGACAAYVGSDRGENGALWFFIGFIFGPLGLMMAFFCGVKCPYCLKRINSKALKCPHCHSDLYFPHLPLPSLPAQIHPVIPPAHIIYPQAQAPVSIDWKKAGLIAGAIAVVILIVIALAPDRDRKSNFALEETLPDSIFRNGNANPDREDHYASIVAKYGAPDSDWNTEKEFPRPKIISRFITYKQEHLRIAFTAISPDLRKWSVLSYIDIKNGGKEDISHYDAQRLLKARRR